MYYKQFIKCVYETSQKSLAAKLINHKVICLADLGSLYKIWTPKFKMCGVCVHIFVYVLVHECILSVYVCDLKDCLRAHFPKWHQWVCHQYTHITRTQFSKQQLHWMSSHWKEVDQHTMSHKDFSVFQPKWCINLEGKKSQNSDLDKDKCFQCHKYN